MRNRGVGILAVITLLGVATGGTAEASGIEGTYKLVKRVMADGSVATPPAVFGFETYGHGVRNFNVRWSQPDGTPASLSLTSGYSLKDGKYCEKPMFWLSNNVGKPGMSYEWPPDKDQCSDVVMMKGGGMTFTIKGEPVVVTFDGNGFQAKAEGMFTDVWERVK